MEISVIVLTKNRKQDLIDCLESICKQSLIPDEVVIVDASDTSELGLELKNSFGNKLNINYIYSENPGLCADRNLGVRKSNGDYLVFLDDDVVLDKDYLKEIMHVFETYPEYLVGGVTGEVFEKEDKRKIKKFINRCYNAYATVFLMHRHGNGKYQLSGASTLIKNGSVNKIINIEYLYGCNMAFRRKIFEDFSFNESLRTTHTGWIGEDDDIAYTLLKKYKNFYTPFAKLVHNFAVQERRANDYDKLKIAITGTHELFKKNLPQDFKHKAAFWWTTTGFLIKEAIVGIKRKDFGGTKGLIRGCQEILKK